MQLDFTPDRTRRIDDYALIGDCESAALVDRGGTIEWLCWPRFDSEACFAALLGNDANGRWRLAPEAPHIQQTRRYREDTLILETRFETEDGAAVLVDFMPIRGEASDVIRIVIGERGHVRWNGALRLAFDYGRLAPRWIQEGDGKAVAVVGPSAARLTSDAELAFTDGECTCEFTVDAGQSVCFVLTYFVSYGRRPADVDPRRALEETSEFWSGWVARCGYAGPYRDAVVRSLIVMKALIHRPTGGIVAAPTSSLPEVHRDSHNWDYRFCWLRDATFLLLSLIHAGFDNDADTWRSWLLRAAGGDARQLQPVYGLGGEARLPEWEADWLSGFNGARPVRFGNEAYRQRQLDIYGEVIDALFQAQCHGMEPITAAWQLQLKIIAHLERVWREPDQGIWESRKHARRYTHSQVMIWVAFDRVIRTAEEGGLSAPLDRWRRLHAAVHEEICAHGYDSGRGVFTRTFGSSDLDASLLLLPQLGFLPPNDPRVVRTVEAIGNGLAKDGFILRYEPGQTGPDAPFLACSFWYTDALTMLGRTDEARAMFDRLLSVRNDVGLLSEEYDPTTGSLTGNFPQALSHLSLVNSALNLFGSKGPAHRRSGLA
jgi:GH15 family glucan-1,4-alpha-glucosidase